MIHQLYAIFDQKTRAFDSPFMSENDNSAIRAFGNIIQQVPLIKNHPEDFDLYGVGNYDQTSGKIIPQEIVQKIANGLLFTDVNDRGEKNDETTQIRNDPPI